MKNLTDFSPAELIIMKNELEAMLSHNLLIEGSESMPKEQKEKMMSGLMPTNLIVTRIGILKKQILHSFETIHWS